MPSPIEQLESKAAELRKDLQQNPDPREVELRELEIAIKVLKKYPHRETGTNGTVPIGSTTPLFKFKARPGSVKEFVASFLKEHGPTDKITILDALRRSGRTITVVTFNSALSKSGGLFTSDGNGVWRLAES